MSRERNKSVAARLASATCALLGTSAVAPVHAQEDPGWEFNTSLLYYGENDNRVEDISLSFLALRRFVDDKVLSLSATVDSLTGATPLGATPFDGSQTFTTPSGNAVFTTPPNEIPLDDTFLDTRYAIAANWQQPLGRLNTISAGITASNEYDYLHVGANVRFSRDFNKRNTTLSAALAVARDEWDPVGGIPAPLSPMLDVGDLSNRGGPEDKDVVDIVLGLTQVINRNLLVQLNYSYSDSSGYLNDPFKIISLVNPVTGDPIPRQQTPGVEGPSNEYRYESRPDARTKHSVFAQAKYYMSGKVLDASYRFMTDDWEIDSHTVDLRYRWPIGQSSYLEPHIRFYTQSHADFYVGSWDVTVPLPAYASADYRLGEFDALTFGLKFGWKLASGNEMSLRLESYSSDGTVPDNLLIGNQQGSELYPDLDAIIVQFGYSFGK